jgi:hypothetical protein
MQPARWKLVSLRMGGSSNGTTRPWPAARRRRMLLVTLWCLLVLVVAIATFLSYSGVLDRACGDRNVGCDLLSNTVFAGIVGLAGYLYFVGFKRRRVLKRYIGDAQASPERLFRSPPVGTRADDVVGREKLYDRVTAELRASSAGGAIVVIGETGSGKTTFLLGLTRYLARSGAVPINISLRGERAPLQLRRLAREHFLDYIDVDLKTSGEADRVWRSLSTGRSLIVLADGLDEAALGSSFERLDAVRRALDAASAARLPILITSRLESAPPSGEYPAFDLPPLSPKEAVGYISSRAERVGEAGVRGQFKSTESTTSRIKTIVDLAEITRTPFYLNITSDLLLAGRLDKIELLPEKLIRIRLLNEYIDGVEAGEITSGEIATGIRREVVIGSLPRIATAMTRLERLELSLSDLRAGEEGLEEDFGLRLVVDDSDVGLTVDEATHLGLLQTQRDGAETLIRFTHGILHSYFLQKILHERDALWAELIDCTNPLPPAELMTALVLRCEENERRALAAGERPDLSINKAIAKELLDRSEGYSGDVALRAIVTAVELLRDLPEDHVAKLVGTHADNAWMRSSRPGKVSAVALLRQLDLPWSYSFLYERTRDRGDYAARWAAAQALIDGGSKAFDAISSHAERLIDHAESSIPTDASRPVDFDIAVLGWILPALASSVDGPRSSELSAYVDRLIHVMLKPGVDQGIEASLAQGLKADAMRFPNEPSDRDHVVRFDQALAFLEGARFWYSRIMLLHGIGRRCIAVSDRLRGAAADKGLADGDVYDLRNRVRQATSRLEREARDVDRHPFVRRAARLCLKAIKAGDWERFVWEDENVVISRATSKLQLEAHELVADIVMLLTLIEQERIPRARQMEVGRRSDLPYCLDQSPDRAEFRSGCSCEFGLCPYPAHISSAAGRNTLSQGFSRELAMASTAWRLRPSSTQLRRRKARRFWEEMASHASRH